MPRNDKETLMRIVSLLPAATEIVCALGLRERLVGRSHECDFPGDVTSLPVLTRARVDSTLPSDELDADVRRVLESGQPLYDLDEETLQALAPDVVVTQAACEVCAISYEQVTRVAARAVPGARVVSLQPARLADVLQDVQTVAAACGVPERGAEVAATLNERLDAVRAQATPRRPRVAVLEWLAPPMLAAQWVPDLLEAAGAIPVGPPAGALSPYVEWGDIARLDLDALVVAPCGFDLVRTSHEASAHRDRLATMAPRVLLVDGNAYWNRPGPRLVDAVEALSAWLYERASAESVGQPL
jgi:iron complex transport system substrate-binding protein